MLSPLPNVWLQFGNIYHPKILSNPEVPKNWKKQGPEIKRMWKNILFEACDESSDEFGCMWSFIIVDQLNFVQQQARSFGLVVSLRRRMVSKYHCWSTVYFFLVFWLYTCWRYSIKRISRRFQKTTLHFSRVWNYFALSRCFFFLLFPHFGCSFRLGHPEVHPFHDWLQFTRGTRFHLCGNDSKSWEWRPFLQCNVYLSRVVETITH